jgi:hypothetical protein
VLRAQLIGQVQRLAARAELLEHHQLHAVGVHLERHRQGLPAQVAAQQAVTHAGHEAHHAVQPGRGLGVGQRDQRGLERLTQPQPCALGQEQQRVHRRHQVGRGLQDGAARAQQAVERRYSPHDA